MHTAVPVTDSLHQAGVLSNRAPSTLSKVRHQDTGLTRKYPHTLLDELQMHEKKRAPPKTLTRASSTVAEEQKPLNPPARMIEADITLLQPALRQLYCTEWRVCAARYFAVLTVHGPGSKRGEIDVSSTIRQLIVDNNAAGAAQRLRRGHAGTGWVASRASSWRWETRRQAGTLNEAVTRTPSAPDTEEELVRGPIRELSKWRALVTLCAVNHPRGLTCGCNQVIDIEAQLVHFGIRRLQRCSVCSGDKAASYDVPGCASAGPECVIKRAAMNIASGAIAAATS